MNFTPFKLTIMNQIIITYVAYLIISVCMIIRVAKSLFKNGKVFLHDIFHGNKELADSVNGLLLVGFYLINIGYAVYTLQIHHPIQNTQEILERLSVKIGTIILILGGMHFLNLYIFFNLRKRTIGRPGHKNAIV